MQMLVAIALVLALIAMGACMIWTLVGKELEKPLAYLVGVQSVIALILFAVSKHFSF